MQGFTLEGIKYLVDKGRKGAYEYFGRPDSISSHELIFFEGREYFRRAANCISKGKDERMKLENLIRFGAAAHHSCVVESPYSQRGGILLVAGPGCMKSTIVANSLKPFPNALVYSDLTIKQLAIVRSQIANGMYSTLGFTELEKIYARQLPVALNFEGAIKAMVEEGFSHFAFEDQRCWVPTARCFMYASVLDNLYRFHFPRWMENGFLRRFVVIKYRLSEKTKLVMRDALHEGEYVPMPSLYPFPIGVVRMDVTPEESRKLERICEFDSTMTTPLNLVRKVFTILKWYRKQNGKRSQATPMEVIEDLADGISSRGGVLDL
jgi:hypothetical protein